MEWNTALSEQEARAGLRDLRRQQQVMALKQPNENRILVRIVRINEYRSRLKIQFYSWGLSTAFCLDEFFMTEMESDLEFILDFSVNKINIVLVENRHPPIRQKYCSLEFV